MNVPSAHEVLGAMITPAVLISASGTLVLSTSNRLSRVVDRVRVLTREAEGLAGRWEEPYGRLIRDQMARLAVRVGLLRAALTTLYAAIGLLVATSIAVGVSAAFGWAHGWVAILLGLVGAAALFHGSLLLVREARLGVGSTLQELDYMKRFLPPGADRTNGPP